MFRNRLAIFVLGVLVVGPIGASSSPPLKVHEDLLGQKADAKPFDDWDIVSPDGERVAWREPKAKQWVVKVNGDPMGTEFEKIEWIIFSPDSKRVAYRAKQGKNWVAVVDGKPGSPYREIGHILFSPDNQRAAYVAKKGKKWVTVADGKEGEEFDEVRSTVFSPDSQHLIYPGKRKKKWVMVVDGNKQGPEMREVMGLIGFVPESQVPFYAGQIGKKAWSIFIEYSPGPEFEVVATPDFDAAGARAAYAGARFEKPFMKSERAFGRVIVDGAPGPEYEGRSVLGLGGSMNDRLARGFLPRFWPRSHGVSSPALSPDGRHIAYGARRGDGDYIVFFDGEAGPSFENNVCNPSFAPDGRLFYVGIGEGMLSLMVNGVKAGEFAWEGVDACSPTFFTEDGTHSAFVALEGGRWYELGFTRRAKRRIFVDGQAGPEYDARQLANVTFFSEGEEFHFAYVVNAVEEDGQDVSFAVIDELEGKRYDRVLPGTLRFVDSKKVSFTAQKGRSFYRVTHELPSKPRPTED